MSFLIGALMVGLGVVGLIVAVTGTQGQLWNAVTGHSATGTLLAPAATPASAATSGTPPTSQLFAAVSGGSTVGGVA